MWKYGIAAIALIAFGTTASATDWTGQSLVIPGTPSSIPGFPSLGQDATFSAQLIPRCTNGAVFTPPPCPAGLSPSFGLSGGTAQLSTVPTAFTAPTSSVYVSLEGYFADPSSPYGVSRLNGAQIALSAFATGSSVDALQNSVNQMGVSLNDVRSQIAAEQTAIAGLAEQIARQDVTASQGTAQAIAMGGLGYVGSDENYSFAMNLGVYRGQTAGAMGFAVRADQHLSFNGALSATGSDVGARVGFRIGW